MPAPPAPEREQCPGGHDRHHDNHHRDRLFGLDGEGLLGPAAQQGRPEVQGERDGDQADVEGGNRSAQKRRGNQQEPPQRARHRSSVLRQHRVDELMRLEDDAKGAEECVEATGQRARAVGPIELVKADALAGPGQVCAADGRGEAVRPVTHVERLPRHGVDLGMALGPELVRELALNGVDQLVDGVAWCRLPDAVHHYHRDVPRCRSIRRICRRPLVGHIAPMQQRKWQTDCRIAH